MNELWLRVASFLPKAKAMAWDECHKIYLLMDDEQVLRVREHGGYILVESPTLSDLSTIQEWYEESCWLKFVKAIYTTEEPNDGFVQLTEQFASDEF